MIGAIRQAELDTREAYEVEASEWVGEPDPRFEWVYPALWFDLRPVHLHDPLMRRAMGLWEPTQVPLRADPAVVMSCL